MHILHYTCNDANVMKNYFAVVIEGGGAQYIRLKLVIISLLICFLFSELIDSEIQKIIFVPKESSS